MASTFDDEEETTNWAEAVLSDVDTIKAAKYRDQLSYLDRKLEGLPDEIKSKVLRVMINTDISPTDSANIITILYGHIEAIAKTIPELLQTATTDIRGVTEDFTQEVQIFPEVVAQVIKRIMEEITEQALQLGQSGVKTAAVEEIERMRLRLTATTEELLKQFLDNALKEKSARSTDVLVLRHRAITAIAGAVIVLLGFLSGSAFGAFHGILTSDQKTQISYGREFIQMYPQMPESMTIWVKGWVKSHPTP